VDIAGADVLANEAERRRTEGGGLYLINAKSGLRESLEECHAVGKIGPENIFPGKSVALRTIFEKMDMSVCRNCKARIFLECATVPADEPGETEIGGQVVGL